MNGQLQRSESWAAVESALREAKNSSTPAYDARIARLVRQAAKAGDLPAGIRTLRVACLRSVTVEPLIASAVHAFARRGFAAEFELGSLGAFAQEMLDDRSFVHQQHYDACIVLASYDAISPQFADPTKASAGADAVGPFLAALDALLANFDGLVVVNNFAPPLSLIAPRLQAQRATSVRYEVEAANRTLADWAGDRSRIYLADAAAVASRMGTERFYSARDGALAMQPHTPAGFRAMADDWAAVCDLALRAVPKCLVLDCDNTLWGGIVGEDGLTGICLGEGYPGDCYHEFQRQLKCLSELGFLLALASRNNETDVRAVFDDHPRAALRWNDFAATEVNWRDKAENLTAIAERLRLGVDSLVFVDDSPLEIERVRSALPGVTCLQAPSDAWALPSLLAQSGVIDRVTLTNEDRIKTSQYASERHRSLARATCDSFDGYLRGLVLELTVSEFDEAEHLERALQLLQKTNQFNLTTRRHTASDLRGLLHKGARIYIASLKDRFGDYGRIALAIAVPTSSTSAHLDTYLMSCRALGRRVEYSFIAWIAQQLADSGSTRLTAERLPTSRNAACADFLPEAGFTLVAQAKDAGQAFALDLNALPNVPSYITIRSTQEKRHGRQAS